MDGRISTTEDTEISEVKRAVEQRARSASEGGAHAPPRAVSDAPVGNSAGAAGWVRTMIPKRYRPLSPAARQRGRSPEHARARMLPVTEMRMAAVLRAAAARGR